MKLAIVVTRIITCSNRFAVALCEAWIEVNALSASGDISTDWTAVLNVLKLSAKIEACDWNSIAAGAGAAAGDGCAPRDPRGSGAPMIAHRRSATMRNP